MSAGLLFGSFIGTIIVSISGTVGSSPTCLADLITHINEINPTLEDLTVYIYFFLPLLQVAAAAAFLIARYFARDRILKLVEGNKKFLAIDKAIGENGFRVVTLLRLSPLLPFSLGNYLYGLTSVKFVPYVLGRLVHYPLNDKKIFSCSYEHHIRHIPFGEIWHRTHAVLSALTINTHIRINPENDCQVRSKQPGQSFCIVWTALESRNRLQYVPHASSD